MAQMTLEDGIAALARRTIWLRIALYAYIACTAAMVLLWGAVLGQGIDQNTSQGMLVGFAGLASSGYLLTFLASIVLVCLWVYRAHANLFATGFEGLEFTPGWSVGWFFVPVAFWFKPFQAMRELWNASHLQTDDYAAPADHRLVTWWAFWVIGNIIANVNMRIGGMGGINVFDLVAWALQLGAAVFLLIVVNAITRAQTNELNVNYAFT